MGARNRECRIWSRTLQSHPARIDYLYRHDTRQSVEAMLGLCAWHVFLESAGVFVREDEDTSKVIFDKVDWLWRWMR